MLTDLKENPYPEDVFLPVSKEELQSIHLMLQKEFNMPIDRLAGHIGRVLRKGIIKKATELLAEEKRQIETGFADGFVEGYATGKSGEQKSFPEQYFTETFESSK